MIKVYRKDHCGIELVHFSDVDSVLVDKIRAAIPVFHDKRRGFHTFCHYDRVAEALDRLNLFHTVHSLASETQPEKPVKTQKKVVNVDADNSKLIKSVLHDLNQIEKRVAHEMRPYGSASVTRKRLTEYQSRMESGLRNRGRMLRLRALLKRLDDGEQSRALTLLLKKRVRDAAAWHKESPSLAQRALEAEGLTEQERDEVYAYWDSLAPDADHFTDAEQMVIEMLKLELHRPEGYYATPSNLARDMVDVLEIEDDHRVLEPSAGTGALALAVADAAPGAVIDCIEVNHDCRRILKLRGMNVIANDFSEFESQTLYDRIVMNPPFENGVDIAHVRRAYNLLAADGKMAAIVSKSFTFSSKKAHQLFREWLATLDTQVYELPPKIFSGTSVGAVLILFNTDDSYQYSVLNGLSRIS
jgi:predicted RNA methylase